MEQLLLRPLLARDELHIVHEPHIDVPLHLTEVAHAARLDGVDIFLSERLAGQIGCSEAVVAPVDKLAYGMQEVRLAQPRPSVDEQRVVLPAGRIGDGPRSRKSQPVARTLHKPVEREPRDELRFRKRCLTRGPRGLRRGSGRLGLGLRRTIDGDLDLDRPSQALRNDAGDLLEVLLGHPLSSEITRRSQHHGVVVHREGAQGPYPPVEGGLVDDLAKS